MDVTMKSVLLIPIVALFISVNVLAETKEECVTGGGEWIVPQNIDPREGDERSPYCQCEQGQEWNRTGCPPISAEILCESSDGVWADETCECPEESRGWNDQVGCDYVADIESDVAAAADSKTTTTTVIVLLLLLLCAVVMYFIIQKKKKQSGAPHEK